jgi:hypothetical protein
MTAGWLEPVLVAQIEFLEWTGENHLRHTTFIALRDDKRTQGAAGVVVRFGCSSFRDPGH